MVLSPESVQSEWVGAELHWVIENRPDLIVPVLIKTCVANDLHLRSGRIQYIDFRGNLQDAQHQLLKIWNIDYEYKRQQHELRLVQGPYELQGSIYPIRSRIIVGRVPQQTSDRDCTVITIADITLSSIHAEFELQQDGFVHVWDLQSRSGSFVKRRRLERSILHDGDEIRLGNLLFVYRHFAEASKSD